MKAWANLDLNVCYNYLMNLINLNTLLLAVFFTTSCVDLAGQELSKLKICEEFKTDVVDLDFFKSHCTYYFYKKGYSRFEIKENGLTHYGKVDYNQYYTPEDCATLYENLMLGKWKLQNEYFILKPTNLSRSFWSTHYLYVLQQDSKKVVMSGHDLMKILGRDIEIGSNPISLIKKKMCKNKLKK